MSPPKAMLAALLLALSAPVFAQSVTITSPKPGTTVVETATITIVAAADAKTKAVSFFANGVKIGSADSAKPFSRDWSGMLPGAYAITAQAIDSSGKKSALAAPVNVTVSAVPVVVPVPAGLLQQKDITYLGSCVLPATLASLGEPSALAARSDQIYGSGSSYLENQGLAYGVIGGTPSFFSTADARFDTSAIMGELYRFHCSSLSTSATYPAATLDERYGDWFDGKRVYGNDTGPNNDWWSGPGGLFYRNNGGSDEMWWTASPGPYGITGNLATLGYSTLSIGGSSGTGQKEFKFTYGQSGRTGSFLPIPASWQSRFGGHPMMLTNRGTASNNEEWASPDPVIAALEFPSGAHLSTVDVPDYKILMGPWGFTRCTDASSTGPSKRLLRPSWLPALHFNYWDGEPNSIGECNPSSAHWDRDHTILNESPDATIFIDTGTKYGVLVMNHRTLGGPTYTFANIFNAGWTTEWSVINPTDLASVYAGTTSATAVTYASSWGVQYPVFNYSASPFVSTTGTATIQANGTTDRFRITFGSTFDLSVSNGVMGYGATNSYYNKGYIIDSVVTPGLVYDACWGQACLSTCLMTHDLTYCQAYGLDLADVASSAVTLDKATLSGTGIVIGAVWMPTNSACGQDNTFAVAVDADDGGGLKRYIHCYKVN